MLLALTAVMPTSVFAHDAGTYTILVKESGFSHNSPQLVFNDSAFWYNVDNSSNITHRIVFDSDGDGLYNGTLDWDSGNLSYECERDEFGNQTDPDCKVTFEITFNGTWGPGTYNYQDLMSNGTVYNGTVVVQPDWHPAEGDTLPLGGYEFGNVEEDIELDSQTEENNSRDWLLWVAGASGLLSLLLIGLLILGFAAGLDEENTENLPLVDDNDIQDIIEEE
ncbi:MAG: hypothetical protein CMO20_03810 [Thermoplasmata archaeon]|nr:hypothetical protein [Thermoplasmata archaeon]